MGIARTLLVAGLLLASPGRAEAATGDCGTPLSSSSPKTSDCLYILGAAVGVRSCAPCTCDVNDNGDVTAGDALLCLRSAVGQDVALVCPECGAGCPGFVEWSTHGGIGEPCDADEQCVPGTCDEEIGRCRTSTELDLGWTGRAHDIDLDAGSLLRVIVACEGDSTGCGQCDILGVDPASGNCRCANDARAVCDQPFEADAGNCPACAGGAFAGLACSGDAQCEGGPCGTWCHFDPQLPCTTNADCPAGRKRCDSVAACGDGDGIACSDDGDCLGTCTAAATCDCYEAPPQPVASVEFPFCLVARLAADVSGTVDVDSGASLVAKDLRLAGYGGLSLPSPCPVCGGTCTADPEQSCVADEDCGQGDTCARDGTAGDGLREGSCVGGRHDGQSCDVQATSASFPADTGGGGYSLDCMPDGGASVTGPGLRSPVVETTGAASLAAGLPCDPAAPLLGSCPCLVCTGGANVPCSSDEQCAPLQSCSGLPGQACDSNTDCLDFDLGTCTAVGSTRCSGSTSTPCSTNADCASVDFGDCAPATCSSFGTGEAPKADSCDAGACSADGQGESSCPAGPDDKFCDGLVQADGGGIRRCNTDEDCSAAILGFDAGACTLVEPRACFLDPIDAEGAADPEHPLAVATSCVSPGTNISANRSLGLPGPARVRRQLTQHSFCASDPGTPYLPGLGGCP